MLTFGGPMRTIAVVAVILSLTVIGTDGNKAHNCCTEVSTQNITVPILGYRIQRRDLPCVRAIIFETEEGEICSHWKQDWVFKKVQEIERERKRQRASTASQ
ncbi:hypothetical protein AAFF_G00206680 [Aldrovandia affinis]|uniref:Chemokine interleukin-8-like domain-containing protein n=1 Tax=Aldrovandia affinis TaxID=143900 RepID=A0AAD7W4U5_9TELE|nr:hypothetical protein AAFF_G00206680 [Aldrovandia affinis]